MIFRKLLKSCSLAVWIYEVLLASPFSPKMVVATNVYKRVELT